MGHFCIYRSKKRILAKDTEKISLRDKRKLRAFDILRAMRHVCFKKEGMLSSVKCC